LNLNFDFGILIHIGSISSRFFFRDPLGPPKIELKKNFTNTLGSMILIYAKEEKFTYE